VSGEAYGQKDIPKHTSKNFQECPAHLWPLRHSWELGIATALLQ
jgi:hypothetical protein